MHAKGEWHREGWVGGGREGAEIEVQKLPHPVACCQPETRGRRCRLELGLTWRE